MEIRGSRITIKPLEESDVYKMRNWGNHKNPLLDDYDFPVYSDEEIKRWYRLKTQSPFNRYFSVYNEEYRLIGYMGIKDIRVILRKSTLGIVFDPNYLNQGYGSETLKCFLHHYFTKMRMRIMYLEVAEFNKRAYRVYEKMGFKTIAYYLDEFHNSKLDLTNSYYLEEKSSFVITPKKIYNYIYKMKLDKASFLERLENI